MLGGVVRVISILVVALVVAVGVVGCGDSTSGLETDATSPGSSSDSTGGDGRTFTLAELAGFDGQDGRAAYVAVDGVVYDVSDSLAWPQGAHSPCNLGAAAGQDMSEIIRQAPSNMRALLERMPVIGSLTE